MDKIDITELRKRLGKISQAELARRMGVDQATVWRWEHGRSAPSGPAEIILRQLSEGAQGAAA